MSVRETVQVDLVDVREGDTEGDYVEDFEIKLSYLLATV
jgi:hypothetical protein